MVLQENKSATTISAETENEIWAILQNVKDPEIPVLTVVDMGIVTAITVPPANSQLPTIITISPTFVGCPAIDVMKKNIAEELAKKGFEVIVQVDFETKWTSDRMTAKAREKLERFGIAPPAIVNEEEPTEEQLNRVRCPHCQSIDTTLRGAFGSTLCRAIRFCFSCKQGFEQFKPIG